MNLTLKGNDTVTTEILYATRSFEKVKRFKDEHQPQIEFKCSYLKTYSKTINGWRYSYYWNRGIIIIGVS